MSAGFQRSIAHSAFQRAGIGFECLPPLPRRGQINPVPRNRHRVIHRLPTGAQGCLRARARGQPVDNALSKGVSEYATTSVDSSFNQCDANTWWVSGRMCATTIAPRDPPLAPQKR